MSKIPLQDIIDKIESFYTQGELRNYLAQLFLDVRYANAYIGEAWEIAYPNPEERLHYIKIASGEKEFIPFEK